jgi:hypothetical protein
MEMIMMKLKKKMMMIKSERGLLSWRDMTI